MDCEDGGGWRRILLCRVDLFCEVDFFYELVKEKLRPEGKSGACLLGGTALGEGSGT